MNSTYSFADLSVVLSHPAIGQLTLQGEGLGSVTFTMTEDVSSHDLAADGSVMTSKIEASNGTVAISVQQTSFAHTWLTRLYNFLKAAPSRQWALNRLRAQSSDMRITHEASGMSIQKRGDKAYEAQGGQVVWTFLAANLAER